MRQLPLKSTDDGGENSEALPHSAANAEQIRWRSCEDRNEVRRGVKNTMRAQAKRGLVVRMGDVGDAHDAVALWALPEHAQAFGSR